MASYKKITCIFDHNTLIENNFYFQRMGASFLFHRVHWLLLGLVLVLGMCVFEDFGLAWDEEQQRIIGQTSFNYVFENDSALLTFHDRTYGVAFELPLIILERALQLEDSRWIYLVRHLITHLFFLISAFFFFKVCLQLFKNRWVALAGMLLLLTFPRLYAHSFFNTKDLPFLSMFIIAWFTLLKGIEKGSSKHWLIHGAVVGLLMNLRLMGMLMVVLTIGWMVLQAVKTGHYKIMLQHAALFIVACCTALYLSWPYLWSSPFEHFAEAITRMSSFEWRYDVLYLGEYVSAMELPWHYAPTWIALTVPLHVLLLGMFGMVAILFFAIRSGPKLLSDQIMILANAVVVLGSIGAVVVLGSTLYDDWRQLYYIYPSILVLALFGFVEMKKRSPTLMTRVFVVSILILYQGWTILEMVRAHPNQQVVFNELMPSPPGGRRTIMDLDHWGLSYRYALEYLLQEEPEGQIHFDVANAPGCLNKMILEPHQRKRSVCHEGNQNSPYYISNYRWEPNGLEGGNIIWSLCVQQDTINSIYFVDRGE